jgi:hypothetical protein
LDLVRIRRGVLALLGPSGSGKSSLVAAGLLPTLSRGGWPGTGECRVLRPSTDPAGLAEVLAEAEAGEEPAVLIIDQFEELLSLPNSDAVSAGPDLADRVLTDLVRISGGDGPGRVLLVLRDDFYPQLARRSPALMEHLAQGRILNLTDQLTPTDLVEIITGPARSQGWNVDPVLTDRLTRDMLDQRTHRAPLTDLPLLALTLRKIWDTAATTSTAEDGGAGGGMVDNTLTAAHYDRVGGVREAFATWCDQAYRDIPAPQQVTARALVTALVHDADPALAVPVMRRRRTLTELTALVDDDQGGQMLDALTEARIITTSHDPGTGQVVVELAHDTLIEQWDALQVWLEHDRDRRRWLDRTEDRARHWDDTGRQAGLLEDDDLTEALRYRDTGPVPDLVAAYIDASHRRQRTRARTRHLIQAALVVLTLVSVVFGLLANARNQEAIKERNQAILNQVIAEAGQVRDIDPSLAAQLDLVAHRMHPGPDSTTRLLSTTQTALASPLTGHTGMVFSVAYGPDGKTLASASYDQTVQLWDLDANHAIRRLCACSVGALTREQWAHYIPQLPYDPPCSHYS